MIESTRSAILLVAVAALSLGAGCSSSPEEGGSGDDGGGAAGASGGGGRASGDASVSSTGSSDASSGGAAGDASGPGNAGDDDDGDAGADGGSSSDAAPVPGAPSAVGSLEMTNQGASSIAIKWTAATAGKAPIAHYQIYRNGSKLATTTSLTYTDATATGATTPGYGPEPSHPATTYAYDVTAVDSAGLEGPRAAQMTAWVYNDGTAYWGGQDYDAPDLKANYSDTAGAPESGGKDISITMNGSDKWWQPYSGAPFLTTDPSIWCMELGAFHYMTIDLKPTKANQTWTLNIISRLPPGDVFNSASVTLPGTFGPAPEVGKWATYKVPFLPASGAADGSSLEVGYGKLTGSISGTTLTVTGNISGLNVQPGSWLTGTGLAPNTYITGPQQATGGPGQYTIAPSQNVASTTISAQRTNMYKFSLIDQSSDPQNVYYADKIGFTTN
jgi:hypothetical protein